MHLISKKKIKIVFRFFLFMEMIIEGGGGRRRNVLSFLSPGAPDLEKEENCIQFFVHGMNRRGGEAEKFIITISPQPSSAQ